MVETPDNRLVRDFHKEMVSVYRAALNECNYRATRFIQMVSKYGGYVAAKRLLATTSISEGLMRLAECGRLDIAMETLVLRAPWSNLFTEQELETARSRLVTLGHQLN